MPNVPPLTLEPIFGPPLRPVVIDPERAALGPCVLGRSSGADVQLVDPDGSVSRSHAEVSFRKGEPFPWLLRDCGSRHGTLVNGQRLEPGASVPLTPGDQVRIGPWVLRVVVGRAAPSRRLAHTSDDGRFASTLMQRLGEQPLSGDASRRLAILMRCATEISAARTEGELALAALSALLEGSGLSRGAVLRAAVDSDVEVIAQRGPGEGGFSRSLIQAAGDPSGEAATVVLDPRSAPVPALGQSIVMLDIGAALCVPVVVERLPPARGDAGFVSRAAPKPVGIVDAYLYLDARTRDNPPPLDAEAVGFCQAVARLCGMALTSLQRAALEQEDHRRRAEIEAARDVQRIIMPQPQGSVPLRGGAVRYAMRCLPGRFVAGDLFDCTAAAGGRAVVLLGDVVGKGVAAGMVMANVQAHLSRLLRQVGDPAATLNEVNKLVHGYSDRLSEEHSRVSLFVSLFAAVVDVERRTLTYADAGHGYTLLRLPSGPPVPLVGTGGPPLGVAPDSEYDNATVDLPEGARLILFSDGLAEQRSPRGEAFGIERARAALAATTSPEADVASLVAGLREFAAIAEPHTFADDVTIASLAIAPGGRE